MEMKELGDTGVMVPEIGLGTWAYTAGPGPLQHGVELGAFLIDTAESYGTEDAVGHAIQRIRDAVFVATKVSPDHLRYDEVMSAAEGSLRRLDIDTIDLYQVHWPNPDIPITETMRAMESLVDSGKVKHVGVSNFSTAQLEEAQAAMTNHRIVCNQVPYSLDRRDIERDLLPYCQNHQVTVMAYSPLSRGALAKKRGWWRGGRSNPLDEVAGQQGVTAAQVALAWCLSRPNVIAIPKSDSATRTEENCGASGLRLSEEQMAALDRAFPV